MQKLRVIFFGSGSPASCVALDRLVEVCDVVGLVAPIDGSAAVLRQAAGRKGIPLLQIFELPKDADLFCVATFAQILDSRVLSLPRLGVLTVHPSLLPRHRGPDPLFWTYFDNDQETGVTVHWMTEQVDAGDIVLQARVPVPRGISGVTLYLELAEAGAHLLSQAVDEITNGTARRAPQDARSATTDPSPWKMTWQIPYETWDAERLWHFLRGVVHLELPPFRGLQTVDGFEVAKHAEKAGTTRRKRGALRLYTQDGCVQLGPRSTRSRIRRWLGRRLGS